MNTTNIISVYLNASEAEISEGMNWYPNANDMAYQWGNGDIWTAAGVMSAFSPLTPWYRTMELAKDSLSTGVARTDTLGNATKAAQRILDGEHPLEVLKGLKTRAFATAIATRGKTESVTIDSHALSIAMGYPIASKKAKIGVRRYRELSALYVDVADMIGVYPAVAQAIVWPAWRNMHFNKATRKGEDG